MKIIHQGLGQTVPSNESAVNHQQKCFFRTFHSEFFRKRPTKRAVMCQAINKAERKKKSAIKHFTIFTGYALQKTFFLSSYAD